MSQFAKILVFLLGIASFSFAQGPVSVYGALKACTIDGKGRICGSGPYANTSVQVKGISLGWSNTSWESSYFFNANTVNALVDGWKSEVIRVPIGYSEYKGYQTDPTNLTRVKTAVEAALAKDVYVIIDWHSHNADNETDAAKSFFEDMIQTYGADNKQIIYEIYNEPKQIAWATIKTYAETIIGAIRAKGANNLILVGTPQWSARPNQADGNYLSDPNVAYVFHFYAATHKTDNGNSGTNPTYSQGITTVLNAGKPVFVSEYGTVTSSGDGTHDPESTNAWYQFMDENDISSCAWQVSYKDETSALFATSFKDNLSTRPIADFTNENNLKESGKFILAMLLQNAQTAPWINSPLLPSSSSEEPSSSSGDDTPIILPQLVHNNALSPMRNSVNLQATSNATIQIFDLKGNAVRTLKFKQGNYVVQLADLPRGLYIVKATSESWKQTIKVMVK